MDNLLLGLNASVYQLGEIIAILAQFQILWGFLAGFGMAVLMYAFLASAPASTPSAVAHEVSMKRGVFAEVVIALMLLALIVFMLLAVISTLRF